MKHLTTLLILFALAVPAFADGNYVGGGKKNSRRTAKRNTKKVVKRTTKKVVKQSAESPEVYTLEPSGESPGERLDITKPVVELPYVTLGTVPFSPPSPVMDLEAVNFTEFGSERFLPWYVWAAGGAGLASGVVLALRQGDEAGRSVEGDSGGDVAPVPEPVTWLLMVTGLCALAWRLKARVV